MASKDSSIISRWLDVFIPDELTPDRNYDLYIRAQFTLFLCLAGLLTNLIPIYLEGQQFGWTSPISMANYALGIGAATSVVLVWRYSLVSLAATLFVATAIGAMLVTCYYSGGINAAVIVWLGLAPLATAMLANVIGTITVTVIIFLGVGLLAFLQTWGGGLPEPDPAVLAPIAKSVHILSAIVCAGFLGVVHIRILRRSKKKIDQGQRELMEERQKLFQAQKLNILGEMAGGIAHEINNPLTILQGLSDRGKVLKSRGELTSEILDETFVTIDRTVQRVFTIVKGLQEISRDGSRDDVTSCNIWDVVSTTLDVCREKLRAHDIELLVEVPQNLFVQAREVQMSQVLLNLLGNSIDELKHQAKANPQGPRWIKIRAEALASGLEVRVSDSGGGVHPSLRDKIMHPFFTTKEIGQGTGLGLSISDAIMKGFGGQLFLDADQKHTTFVMKFSIRTSDDRPDGQA